jgi:hypothetical protein
MDREPRDGGMQAGNNMPPGTADGSVIGKAAPVRWVLGVLALVVCVCLVWLVVAGFPPGLGRLNVLLITLDTTRADFLGCYGRAGGRTPRLDAFAHRGTVLQRCSTCSSLTLPSHTSIITGTYPFVHGVRRNGTDRAGDANVVLAEVLRDSGYATRAAQLHERLRKVIADAPPPIRERGTVELGPEEIARLQALGYAQGAPTTSEEDLGELDRFDPKAPTPPITSKLSGITRNHHGPAPEVGPSERRSYSAG